MLSLSLHDARPSYAVETYQFRKSTLIFLVFGGLAREKLEKVTPKGRQHHIKLHQKSRFLKIEEVPLINRSIK